MRHGERCEARWLTRVRGQRRFAGDEAREKIDAPGALLKINEIGPRPRFVRRASVPIGLPHHDKPLRLRKRDRLQEHGIDNAEDGRRHADTERERENGGRREAGVATEQAGGVTEILSQHVCLTL